MQVEYLAGSYSLYDATSDLGEPDCPETPEPAQSPQTPNTPTPSAQEPGDESYAFSLSLAEVALIVCAMVAV